METFITISIFSLIGFLSVVVYLLLEKNREIKNNDKLEILKDRLERLEEYVYELELKVLTPDSKLKENIIKMYRDGKDILFIENALKIPRPKIEMILKQYRRETNNLS
jgi:hypothetical protein